ncbi:MAG TPA: class I SAM-dependent methyltransferase, partial [Verrucomicrobiae bacterium]
RAMARLLRKHLPAGASPHIVELGAGDGNFLLRVAGRLHRRWPVAEATLVDRLDALDPETRRKFNRLGWQVRQEIAEAREWLSRPGTTNRILISNLFFHQFETAALAEMLELAAKSSQLVIALEPRRGLLPRFFGRLIWAIGCGPVTRNDARISIRAGFVNGELSALWPNKQRWELKERRLGLFSHQFVARRKS